MPTKEIEGGELYMLVDGAYQKVKYSAFNTITETTPRRKYSLYVRAKILLYIIWSQTSRRICHNQYKIEWFDYPIPAESAGVIIEPHRRWFEKRRSK